MSAELEIVSDGALPLRTTLEEFLRDNDALDAEDTARVSGLGLGEAMKLGGGAAPEFVVRRVA